MLKSIESIINFCLKRLLEAIIAVDLTILYTKLFNEKFAKKEICSVFVLILFYQLAFLNNHQSQPRDIFL